MNSLKKEVKEIAVVGPIVVLKTEPTAKGEYFLMLVEEEDSMRLTDAIHNNENEELMFAKWFLDYSKIEIKEGGVHDLKRTTFISNMLTNAFTFLNIQPSAALSYVILTGTPFYIHNLFLVDEEVINMTINPLSITIDDLEFNSFPKEYSLYLEESLEKKLDKYQPFEYVGIGRVFNPDIDLNLFSVYQRGGRRYLIKGEPSILVYQKYMGSDIDLTPKAKERTFRYGFNSALYLLMKKSGNEIKDIFISGKGICGYGIKSSGESEEIIIVPSLECYLSLKKGEETTFIKIPDSFGRALLPAYERDVYMKIEILNENKDELDLRYIS